MRGTGSNGVFFFKRENGKRDVERYRGLGDVCKGIVYVMWFSLCLVASPFCIQLQKKNSYNLPKLTEKVNYFCHVTARVLYLIHI